jgi:hypothetical protein
VIWARRRPDDWRKAAYRLADVYDLELAERTLAEASAICGYVACDGLRAGERLHPCKPYGPSHRIRVYILKKDNEQAFRKLVARCQR